jgi:predicted ATP-dependent serine protease
MSCANCKTRPVHRESGERQCCFECWLDELIRCNEPDEGTTGSTVVESEPDPDGRMLIAQSFATVKAERTRWLWDGRIPLGTATLLVGRKKLGKSTLTVELAAQLSRGTLAGDLHGQPSNALLVTFEASASRTVKPRLIAAGADTSRVHRVDANIDGVRDLVSLPDDGGHLRDLAKDVKARLLIVDPLSAALNGSVDSHRDQDIRRALAPLVALAEDADLALVAVAQWNKGQSGDALTRVLGSRGLTAAVRSVLAFGVSPDTDDGSLDPGARSRSVQPCPRGALAAVSHRGARCRR